MTTQTNTMAEAFANIKAATTTSSLQERNIKRVQELVAEFQAGRPEGYMAGVADDIKGSVLGGLIPDADNIKNKADFGALMEKMGDYVEMIRFEPTNFRGLPNNDMMFEVNWEMVYKPTGKKIETTAIVRKVLNEDGMICEKYHMCDVAAITKVEESPRDVLAAVGETIPEWK